MSIPVIVATSSLRELSIAVTAASRLRLARSWL